MGASIADTSDTIDYPGVWEVFAPTFEHDARRTPWPVGDKAYDFFVALRVFQHLHPNQRECFLEAKRIAKNVILVVPQHYEFPEHPNSHGITEEQFIEWNDGVPPTLFAELAHNMGHIAYWNSASLSSIGSDGLAKSSARGFRFVWRR